ncbi:hypothetical protein EI94DRAFT_1700713 [Lactarius quietus]|nr:hypothetical protein EI94DRAFT_1700713 [Lactarius quietus]
MSTAAPTALSLSKHLSFIHTCPYDTLNQLVSSLQLYAHLPGSFLDTLDEDDQTICYQAVLSCYRVTGSAQVPCEMQLRAVLSNQHTRDCLVSAGTGSGKTLPIVLSILLDDPDKELITFTLSPLKQLQVTQESDFNTRYGIPTVVINEVTPREDVWWTSCEGHFPQLALLICNLWYQKHIAHVVIAKAHNIHTSGLSHHSVNMFHPAWGRVDELKAILPWNVHWILLSATFPPHIHATVEKKLLHPGYDAIHVTSNRPNTVYTMHEVINSIKHVQNYKCFLVSPFSVESQPHVLIFVDKKEPACQIAAHLYSCLPDEHQDKGIVWHYHSKMSQQYLQLMHNALTEPTGNCRVLVATLGQSVDVDFPDIKIICTAGLPGSMVNILQCGGLQDLLPGMLAVAPLPASTIEKTKRVHNTYHPTQEQPFLECCLNEWVRQAHLADPFHCIHLLNLILSYLQRATLVHADPEKIKSIQDTTMLLDETSNWDAKWSAKVFEVITKFNTDYVCISEESSTCRKCKQK